MIGERALRFVIATILAASAMSKFYSGHSAGYGWGVVPFYGVACVEVLLAAVMWSRWALLGYIGSVCLGLGGAVLAIVEEPGVDCGCWGEWTPDDPVLRAMMAGTLGSLSALGSYWRLGASAQGGTERTGVQDA